MFSRDNNKFLVTSFEQKFNSKESSISVSNSLTEPSAIYKKCKNSFFDFLAAPSAMLTGMDTDALRICDTIPKFSSVGNNAVILYASFTNAKLSFQASRFLCGFMLKYFNKTKKYLPTYCLPLTIHQ